MTDERIMEAVAPCGLCCETCFAHRDGDIRRLAIKLKEKLGNFRVYAERFETLLDNGVFGKYPAFAEMLDYFASENCRGCRNEQCGLFRGCGVRACHQERELDYCFECDRFPCENTNFDPGLYKGWVAINEKIREMGLEKYCEFALSRSRYP
jgi:hypothetical protein